VNRKQRRHPGPDPWGGRVKVPRKEASGIDPGILEDIDAGIMPRGYEPVRRGLLRFYGYNSMNKCCREWILLGWPEVNGRPRRMEDGVLTVKCQKCGCDLHFDIPHPDVVSVWDVATMGEPQPPTIVGGRIRT